MSGARGTKPPPWNVVPAYTSAKAQHMLWSKNPVLVHPMLHPKKDGADANGHVIRNLTEHVNRYGVCSTSSDLWWTDGSSTGGPPVFEAEGGGVVGMGLAMNFTTRNAHYAVAEYTEDLNMTGEMTYITHFYLHDLPFSGVDCLVSAQEHVGQDPSPYKISINSSGGIRIYQGSNDLGNDYGDTSVQVDLAAGHHYILVCTRGSQTAANDHADWDIYCRKYEAPYAGYYMHEKMTLGSKPQPQASSTPVRFGSDTDNTKFFAGVFYLNVLLPKKIHAQEVELWMQDPYEPFRYNPEFFVGSQVIPVSGTWNLPSEFIGQPTPTFNLPSEFLSPAVAATKNLPSEFLLSIEPAVKNLPSEFLSTAVAATKNLPSEFLLNIGDTYNLESEFLLDISTERKLESEFLLRIQTTFNFSWAPPLVYEWERARIHFAKMGPELRSSTVNVGPETRRHMGTIEGETRT